MREAQALRERRQAERPREVFKAHERRNMNEFDAAVDAEEKARFLILRARRGRGTTEQVAIKKAT